MAIRSILAPISGYESDETALVSGLRLARRLGAFVEFLHVRSDPREIIPLLSEGAVGPVAAQMIGIAEKESAEHAGKAARLFEAACKRARAATSGEKALARLESVVGRAPDLVPLYARTADLVMFGRTARDVEEEWRPSLEAALLGSARPVLLLPAQALDRIGRTVALAWNGKPEAARAASAALPLLAKAERVLLMAGTKGEPVQPSLDALATWLGRHRIPGRIEQRALKGWPVGEHLAAEAIGAGADLLVMGAYGHSRMRETILGGATRAVLHEAAIPVLMAH